LASRERDNRVFLHAILVCRTQFLLSSKDSLSLQAYPVMRAER
jgi:hypothetical protein